MGLNWSLVVMVEQQVAGSYIPSGAEEIAHSCLLYSPLWNPAPLDVTYAGELLPFLSAGLERLKADGDCYVNGSMATQYHWLVGLAEYAIANCKRYPSAIVRARRTLE